MNLPQTCVPRLEAWEWIQKNKARSLSDLLGFGSIVPYFLREKIESDDTTSELFQKEKDLWAKISKLNSEERLWHREEWEELWRRMKNYPALQELYELRHGKPEVIETCDWLFSNPGGVQRRVVFVDWLCVHEYVWITILDESLNPKLIKLDILTKDLDEWIDLWNKDVKDVFGRCSSYLDRLVTPIAEYIEPGTLLVLCPTAPLHTVPLHALLVDKRRYLID